MAKSIRFKVGMQVKVNSDKTGVGISNKSVADMGFKNGETVALIKYDSRDETWEVKSLRGTGVRMWIKRKNLAPIEVKAEPQPQLNPFKVGDKVELTNKDAEWASNDDVTTGVEYTVKQVHEPTTGQKVPYIKVSGNGAKGQYWIQCKYFKLAEPKVKAVDLTDIRGWKEGDILSKDILNDGTHRDFYGFTSYGKKWVSMECKGFYGSDARTIEKIKVLRGRLAAKISECSANIWIAIDTLPVKEEPKPIVAETPKRRMAVCVDMDGSFGTSYVVGKVYEIYEETDDYYYLAEMDGKQYQGGMFKHRFKEIVDQSTSVGPRVGDTITADWLNSDRPKAFHGYVKGWRTEVIKCFSGDRKILKIENKDGRMAAAISGTSGIWIDLAELTGEKSTVDKTFTVSISKDKLAAFDKELQALIAKYK